MRFVWANTGLLSFTLRMVTIICRESLCRKGEERESKTRIRLLGVAPALQRDQRGWCELEGGWMGPVGCVGSGFVPSPSPLAEPRAL